MRTTVDKSDVEILSDISVKIIDETSEIKEKINKFRQSEIRHIEKLCTDGIFVHSEKNTKKVNAGSKYVNSGTNIFMEYVSNDKNKEQTKYIKISFLEKSYVLSNL